MLLQVADFIKNDRLNRLNAVVNEVVEERAQRFRGCNLEVSFAYRNASFACCCLFYIGCHLLCNFQGRELIISSMSEGLTEMLLRCRYW